jgi:hypothetical protein
VAGLQVIQQSPDLSGLAESGLGCSPISGEELFPAMLRQFSMNGRTRSGIATSALARALLNAEMFAAIVYPDSGETRC